jgi:hypothetical protein
MKLRQNPLFSLAFFCIAFSASAQYSIPMRTTIQTPYGPGHITTYVPGPGYRYGNYQQQTSQKYKFTIVLKNDSAFTTKTKIDIAAKKHSIKVKLNGIKKNYFPADTKQISRVASNNVTITGIPADTCWLFKSSGGAISTYSFVAELGMNNVIAIQKGSDGAILTLNKQNLQDMVGTTDPKLTALIERDKLIKAIRTYNEKNGAITKPSAQR